MIVLRCQVAEHILEAGKPPISRLRGYEERAAGVEITTRLLELPIGALVDVRLPETLVPALPIPVGDLLDGL